MKRLIVDMSSVCWTALLASKDKEHGRYVSHPSDPDKQVWVNSAGYGYENAMNMVVGAMNRFGIVPYNTILVVAGIETLARRRTLLPGYKSSRETRPQEAYAEFEQLKALLTNELRRAGACTVSMNGVEEDDVIAFLCERLHGECYILSNDGDFTILCDERVHLWKGHELDPNIIFPVDRKYTRLYKALVGDTSDTMPGAYKFGEKAFLNMAAIFDDAGLDELIKLLEAEEAYYEANGNKLSGQFIGRLVEDVAEFKPLEKILANWETVVRCWMAAKLHPDWVAESMRPLDWKPGLVSDKIQDERLAPWRPTQTLVVAGNYEKMLARIREQFAISPFVALDIETSTPPESDEWLMLAKAGSDDGLGVDVLGSKLTGLGLTFGANSQHTVYISVDHRDTHNVASEMARKVVEMIPVGTPVVIHNCAFELPVLKREWGKDLQDNGWQGFLPNARDTAVMSSYVDENELAGLKKLSSRLLEYQQTTYEEVTTKEGIVGSLPPGGRVVNEWKVPVMVKAMKDGEEVEVQARGMTIDPETGEEVEGPLFQYWEKRQYKMNELSAREVFGYGADDPHCTAALYHHFLKVMEVEKTLDVFLAVEQLPAYVLAQAFVDGVAISQERLRQLDAEDTKAFDAAWAIVKEYLIAQGWEGTCCPEVTEITAKSIKEAHEILLGESMETQVRTPSKLIDMLINSEAQEGRILGHYFQQGRLDAINAWIAKGFKGEPVLDLNSPTKMKHLLFNVMKLPVTLTNLCTEKERKDQPELYRAVQKHYRVWSGHEDAVPLTDAEKELIKKKATTSDTAMDFALLECADEIKPILEALKIMKVIDTRRKMFYRPYAHVQHWEDRKVHSNVRQCGTVTRRPTASGPNIYQLPKKGEGVKFREIYIPHHRDAVICSIDWQGQELILGAGQSRDPQMMSCYVGDNLKDIHSITASGAMRKKWGVDVVADLFAKYGADLPEDALYDLFCRLRKHDDKAIAKMADDLRKVAKNVNFGAQYDATPPTLAEQIIIPVADAREFLEAKFAMFPRFEEWKEEVKAELRRRGYVTTMLGARRHLRKLLNQSHTEHKALRQGPNFMIQGSGAEQAKLALSRLWQSGIMYRLDMKFFAWIYDELVWSVHRNDAYESIRVIHEAMTQPYSTLPIPIVGSISLGLDFGRQHEAGTVCDRAIIEGILGKLFQDEPVAA